MPGIAANLNELFDRLNPAGVLGKPATKSNLPPVWRNIPPVLAKSGDRSKGRSGDTIADRGIALGDLASSLREPGDFNAKLAYLDTVAETIIKRGEASQVAGMGNLIACTRNRHRWGSREY